MRATVRSLTPLAVHHAPLGDRSARDRTCRGFLWTLGRAPSPLLWLSARGPLPRDGSSHARLKNAPVSVDEIRRSSSPTRVQRGQLVMQVPPLKAVVTSLRGERQPSHPSFVSTAF